MTRKITTMTDEQWAELPRYREEWYRIGSATGPTYRPIVQETLGKLYGAIGYKTPVFLHLSSPPMALLCFGFLQLLRDQLRGQLRDQLRGQLGDQLRGQLRDQLRGQLYDQLRGQLYDQLGGQLYDQLRGQLYDQLYRNFWGQHEAWWIAFLLWGQQIGAHYTPVLREQLDWWATLARACGWWWPYAHVCLVSERPSVVHTDAQYRLHCEDGPAMAFTDGYGLWAWHGVRISQAIIEAPETLTVERIHAERNAERRRIMIERWGWERYLDVVNAALRDVDIEPAGSAGLRGLYRCDDGQQPMQLLVCCCASTGRTYNLEVPPEVETCQQAANWLAQQDEPLELLVRT